jgi:antitoxin component of RelBE/YafQ-DinJ toxin-antitoxin module
MKSLEIAIAIKGYLVGLAVEGKLPMDLNLLDEEQFAEIIAEHLPTKMDSAVEAASHYLSDADLSIAEQIEAIKNHSDMDDYIDNVEGVLVWGKVETTFTCEEFLDLIGA